MEFARSLTPPGAYAPARGTRRPDACSSPLPDTLADIMRQLAAAQTDARFAGAAWSDPGGAVAHWLPVDNVIMDEAACSTDYITPSLLNMRPQNLVRSGPAPPRAEGREGTGCHASPVRKLRTM
jgi:hypothetical protein